MSARATHDARSMDFLETANRLGHRICRDAVWADDACTWLGWTVENGKTVFATMGSEFYGGTAGIAVFLTRWWELNPSRQVEFVLRGAVQHAAAGLSRLPESQLGFHTGAAGICFAEIEAGIALTDKQLITQGLGHVVELAEKPPVPEALDVVDGSAGLIPLFLDLAVRFDHDELIASAIRHGDHLLQLAHKSTDGWSWRTIPGRTHKNATGFAHGTAGIASALLELHAQTGHQRFRDAVEQAWRYERSTFCPEENNWPDLCHPDHDKSGPHFATKWCHGAVGIGLSRLRAWELGCGGAELQVEIESSLTTTESWFQAREKDLSDFSLCHGMAGNAELFLTAARVLGRPELHDLATRVGQRGVDEVERQGQPWPCGGPPVGETPGLMLGLAGIGMFFLRLHDPTKIDTPLLLRPTLA